MLYRKKPSNSKQKRDQKYIFKIRDSRINSLEKGLMMCSITKGGTLAHEKQKGWEPLL